MSGLARLPVKSTGRAALAVFVASVALLFQSSVGQAACTGNAIVCENQNTGTPESTWDISGSGDPSIQGFATDISYNKGQTATFKISTTASAYTITIYRMGYYQGNGARQIATVTPSAHLPQTQPPCMTDATGLTDCGNWAASATWTIPTTAVSGIYFAKLTRTDTGGSSHIHFIVRDDASTSQVLFQTSDSTWQAYNQYGGNSLYMGGGPGGGSQAGRAYKVSYNRPFATRGQSSGYGTSDFVWYDEYPMVRWLEANGYDVSYFTDMDSDRNGSLIKNHKVFMSVGHDEYWSGGQRANVQAARDAGVNLAFFSGNEVYWKTRWEPSIDGSNTPNRTLVTYKESLANAPIDPSDPPTWTGLWRDPRFSPPADGGQPENALSGTIMMVNRGSSAITVPSTYSKLRFWRNTAIANLGVGQTATLGTQTLGYEWDEDLDNSTSTIAGPPSRPAGLFDLSSTTVNGLDVLLDYGSTTSGGSSTATHHLTLYRAPGGALVFGAGTVQWDWGLDVNHDTDPDTGPATPDSNMQQATLNLLGDMGVLPTTIQKLGNGSAAVMPTPSTDTTPPTSSITAPTNGASVPAGTSTTIRGSTSDAGGGVVAGVEVSVDSGLTWHPASGTASWSYAWTPSAGGTWSILSRAVDDSGNIQNPVGQISVTVTGSTPPPVISNVSASPSGTSATINWTTNEPASSQVQYGTTTAYGSTTPLDSTLVYSHSQTVSGLTAGTTYHFRVTSKDQVGNSATSSDATFSTPLPASQVRVGVQTIQGSVDSDNPGESEAFQFTATTTGSANQAYLYVDASNTAGQIVLGLYADSNNQPGSLLGQATFTNPAAGGWNTVTFPTVDITSGTQYWLAVLEPDNASGSLKYRDVASGGGKTLASSQTTLVTLPATWSSGTTYANSPLSAFLAAPAGSSDTQPPTVSLSAPANGASVSGTNVTVSASASDNVGVASVQFLLDDANLAAPLTAAPYSITWDTTGVTNGTHTLGAQASDAAGNTGTAQTVTVTVSNPPTISAAQANNITAGAATITWTTNTPATSQVNYGPTSAYGSSTTLDTTLVTSHGQSLSGLSASTTYHYQVVSTDSSGNQATSPDLTFTTSGVGPTISAVQATNLTASTATITWTTSSAATSQVNYGPTSAYGSSAALDSTLVTNHSQTLSGLSPTTTYHYQVLSKDGSGNLSVSTDFTFTTTQVACPCSIWSANATPVTADDSDTNAVELGVKFQSDTAGYITGVRFYKGSTNTGTHVGNLWSNTGTLLATATFSNETASGWQQVSFSTPVQIQANTIYVASYHTNVGQYAADGGYFASTGVDNSPLHAPSNATANGNGVYNYSGSSAFPSQTYNSTNYWVDAVFSTTAPPPPPTTITNVAAGNVSSTGATITWSTNNPATSQVAYGTTTAYGSTTTLDTTLVTSHSQTLSGLTAGTTYHYQVQSKDGTGALVSSPDNTFTTGSTVTCPCSIWPSTATPATADQADSNAVELGVKFQSDTAGYITGIRFYKGPTNTGTHVGNLWSSTGTLLATATFSGETASGWQQVTFSTPVQIQANTTYVASYHTNVGKYSINGGYFASAGVDKSPLHVPSNAAANGNGVYNYSANSAFPSQTYNSTNYWVDVVFKQTLP